MIQAWDAVRVAKGEWKGVVGTVSRIRDDGVVEVQFWDKRGVALCVAKVDPADLEMPDR